jgi:hypothetical protein
MHFEIVPGVGIGLVRFAMTRADVYHALGAADRADGRRERFRSG